MGRKIAVWLLLTVPAVALVYQWVEGTASYGQTLHRTGLCSVALLFVAVSVTPLGRLSRGQWHSMLRRQRRAIGVASFAYAVLHTMVYLERKWGADLILREAVHPDLALGWLAFAILGVLALTSNSTSMRRLGPKWQRLHFSVYLAVLLSAAHWAWASFSPTTAIVCSGILGVVQVLRLRKEESLV
jgi:sulfoxide reductase heme-binding subunit YedZ